MANSIFPVVASVFAAAMLFAALAPLWSGWIRPGALGYSGAPWPASAVVITVVAAKTIGLSTSSHLVNMMVVLGALGCGIVLASASFQLKPLPLALLVAPLSLLGAFLIALVLCIGMFQSPTEAELEHGVACSDSGEETEVSRRILFIDYRMFNEVESAVYLHPRSRLSAAEQEMLLRCRVAINRRRSAESAEPQR